MPPWSYVFSQRALKATRVRLNDFNGTDLYKIGAEKRVVEGGLAHISVEAGALMVNSGGGLPFPGTSASELTNLNCDWDMVGCGMRGNSMNTDEVYSVTTP